MDMSAAAWGRGLEVMQLNTVSQYWGRGWKARLLNVYMYMSCAVWGMGWEAMLHNGYMCLNTGGRGQECILLNGHVSRAV